jgi:hypothetical protein
MSGVVELGREKLHEIDGGGLTKVAIATLINHYKFGLHPNAHDVPEFAYGLM